MLAAILAGVEILFFTALWLRHERPDSGNPEDDRQNSPRSGRINSTTDRCKPGLRNFLRFCSFFQLLRKAIYSRAGTVEGGIGRE